MSEKLQEIIEAGGNGDMADVRSSISEVLGSHFNSLFTLLDNAKLADCQFDQPTLDCLISLAEAIFGSFVETDCRQEMALLLLRAVRSLSMSESLIKIQVIIDGFKLLNDSNLTDNQIIEIDRRLLSAGFDIIGKGVSSLCDDLTDPRD